MIKKFISISCFIFFLSVFSYAQDKNEPIIIGQKHSIQSEILNQERPLWVYLPDHYEKSEKAYPVLYLLDGGSNFHHTTASVQFLAKHGRMPEMIVVGIPNTDDRTRDLTPPILTGGDSFPTAGGADNLLDFIKKELMPWVDNKYRTENYKLLVGHSFGGLFAIHTLIHQPDIFNSYIAVSPSLWWDKQNLVLEQTDSFFENQEKLTGHLYMTMGNEGGAMLGGAWKLAALLKEKGPKQFYWEFDHMPEETHGTIPHRSTYKGLEFIFDKWNLSTWKERFTSGGIDEINNYEITIQNLYGFLPKWEERSLNRLGKTILDKGNTEKSLPIFKKSTELFPESKQAWFHYGQNLAKVGQKKEAIKSLKKALTLDSENLQILVSLKRLGENVSKQLPDVKLSKQALENYVGDYNLEIGAVLTITSDGKRLWAEAGSELPTEVLTALGEHRFFVPDVNSTITFQETDGIITKLIAETPDGNFKGEKKIE